MLICTSQRAFLLSSGIAVQNVTLWCVSFYHHVTCLTLLLRKYTTLRLLLKSKRMTVISFVNRYHFWKLLPITFELVASASRNMYFSAPVKVLPYPYSSGVWWKVRPVNQIDACIPTSDIEYHHIATNSNWYVGLDARMGIASDTVVESIQAVLPASVTMIVWADVTT